MRRGDGGEGALRLVRRRAARHADGFPDYPVANAIETGHSLRAVPGSPHNGNRTAHAIAWSADMTPDLLFALVLFAFVTSVTPGPNNLMLLASGANFGFRQSVPHMLGISLGHMAMVFLLGAGLIAAFDVVPWLDRALTVASVLYMTWLAWRLANAAAPGTGGGRGRPLTFLEAAAFQWVNPKAWAMALTAISVYAPTRSLGAAALVAAVFAMVNLPSVSTWTVLGTQIRRFLGTPGRLRAFNWTMAALLMLSLWPVVMAG